MWIIELIGALVDLYSAWRLIVCFGITMGIAAALHDAFPDQGWVWFVSVPLVVAGIGFGFWWQFRARRP